MTEKDRKTEDKRVNKVLSITSSYFDAETEKTTLYISHTCLFNFKVPNYLYLHVLDLLRQSKNKQTNKHSEIDKLQKKTKKQTKNKKQKTVLLH